ncbi:MAG: glycine--tRNA ligase subunit beta [Halioglobus sp.]|nr:glycine--tRNA ligase subunit beta [Halioglobus sp.]
MNTENLLVEIGTEELPPKALQPLALAFRDGIVTGLSQRDLCHGEVRWFATPRRLAVFIADVLLEAPEKQIETLGPPADKARDAAGNWTPAAAGFAKKQGVLPEGLQILETPKGKRLGLRRAAAGAKATQVVNEIIREAIQGLPIPKRMRWGAGREDFVRPVHWIVAMLGLDADHGKIFDLPTSNITYGHRVHSAGPITLSCPENYEAALLEARVVACFEQRRELIRKQAHAQAQGLEANVIIDSDLLDEVTGLVEWPVALTGTFDDRFLAVPSEALISSMKEHQKYFHVEDAGGALKPRFITIANIESADPDQVIAGNERVIRPRLADAAFFFETDKKTPLAERVDALANIVFQQKLGSLYDKTLRVTRLTGLLAPEVGASTALATRAARLCKADLVTDMVLEFADMQGVAGSYYALHDGEEPEVAAAIAQQYWPKFSGDRLPESASACTLGVADRLDTLVGIFGIGQPPSGSKDPFALRRASLAVLRIIVERELDIDLIWSLEQAAEGFPPGTLEAGTSAQVFEYMIERFRAWYEEENITAEVFRSVSARNLSRPLDMHRRVLAVDAFSQLPEALALATANKRVANLLSKLGDTHSFGDVSADLLVEAQEKGLVDTLDALQRHYQQHLQGGDYTAALRSLADLRDPVDAFFDSVLVNTEDQALRTNRLNLLMRLRQLFLQVADISLLAAGK